MFCGRVYTSDIPYYSDRLVDYEGLLYSSEETSKLPELIEVGVNLTKLISSIYISSNAEDYLLQTLEGIMKDRKMESIKIRNLRSLVMARIGTMNVSAEGYTFDFEVYDLNGPSNDAPGVYIFSKETPNSQGGDNHELLYIGETYSFRSRLNHQHEKWHKARNLGMNCICIHVPRNPNARGIIQDRLIKQFKPPLNERINPFL